MARIILYVNLIDVKDAHLEIFSKRQGKKNPFNFLHKSVGGVSPMVTFWCTVLTILRCFFQSSLPTVKTDTVKLTLEALDGGNRKLLRYYKKLMPTIYTDFLGIVGYYKKILSFFIGLFRPIYREVLFSDSRVITHKSVALAAENFMLSMAEIGYDTCPMEGSDTTRVKKILKLPSKAEITMIIGCGIRAENGVYTERFRVPFDDVYKKV